MDNTNKIPDFGKISEKVLREISVTIGVEGEKFFQESFRKKGFEDNTLVSWCKSNSPFSSSLMVQSQDLMNSIQHTIDKNSVTIGTELNYSKIHNEGGIITVTPQMKRFWWAKYYELSGQVSKTKKGEVAVKSRRVNDKAMFCKRMALMKVGSKIKIPKRQFIGESKSLMQQFDKWLSQSIEKEIKDSVNRL